MKELQCWLVLCFIAVMVSVAPSNSATAREKPDTPNTYGSAAVSRVVQIAPDGTLFCNIDDFPPVIGSNIPVILEGIEPAESGIVDKEVIAFLEQTLTSKSADAPPSIVLNNIRRGPTFCLVADVEIDGKDLAHLLVEKGLARRIIRLDAGETLSPSPVKPSQSLQIKIPDPAGSWVASKSSKIFHRSTCPHAKRLSPEPTITFRSRQEAELNGRRPCKPCDP
jgi:endonuclease YncB( thermonuclease family)